MWDLVWTPKTKLWWSWWWHHPAFSWANPTECYLKRSCGRYGFTCSRVSTEICPKDWESRSIFVYNSLFVPFGWAFEQTHHWILWTSLALHGPWCGRDARRLLASVRWNGQESFFLKVVTWWFARDESIHLFNATQSPKIIPHRHIAIWNHLEPLRTHLWIHQASLICCPIV